MNPKTKQNLIDYAGSVSLALLAALAYVILQLLAL